MASDDIGQSEAYSHSGALIDIMLRYQNEGHTLEQTAAYVIRVVVGFMMRRYPEPGRFARILAELHTPIVDALRYWNKELGGPG